MLSGNKRAGDADAVIENKEMSKRPRDDADVAAETPISNQQQSPKVKGDESFNYELEVELEQENKEEDEKE